MNKNQNWRRVLSLLFAMVMLVSIMVVGSVVASADEADVASINGVGYPTLESALETAADGDTVVLLNDCSESFELNFSDKNVTLDGNGKTYTGKMTVAAGSGKLTIKNATLTPANADSKTIILNAATAPDITITECTLKNTGTTGAIVWGQASSTNNKVVVSNCTAANLQYIVGTNQSGSVDVTIDTVEATGMAYLIRPMKATKVTVKNVTYTGLTFVQVKNSTASELLIENVTVTTTASMPPITMLAPDSGTPTVNYSISIKGDNVINGEAVSLDNIDNWFATASPSLEYNVEIEVKPDVAKVGETGYKTLADAIANATAGATITLLADINENVTVNKKLTIDGAGKNYTGTMTLNAGLTVTVTNVNFVNGGIAKTTKSSTGYYTVTNCTFDGNGTYAYPLSFKGAHTVTVENCTVSNYLYSFLYVSSSANTVKVKNVTVENCPNYAVYFGSGVNSATFENLTVKNSNNGFILNNTAVRSLTVKNCVMQNVGTAISGANGTSTIACTLIGANDFGTAAFSQYAKLTLNAVDATLATDKADIAINLPAELKDADYVPAYANGVWSAVVPVAEVNGVAYGSIQAAIDAAQPGDTVKLLKDVSFDGSEARKCGNFNYANLVLADNKQITFDFNGNTLNVKLTAVGAPVTSNMLISVFFVQNGSELTFVDSSEAHTGGINVVEGSYKLYCMIYNSKATVIIKSGNYVAEVVADSLVYADKENNTQIQGGFFHVGNYTIDKPWVSNVHGKNEGYYVVYTGGTFNHDPLVNYGTEKDCEVKLPNGYVVVEKEDGTWSVIKAVAKVGDKYFESLKDAMDDCNKATGEYTITLVANVNESFKFAQKSGVKITIDGNEKQFAFYGKITLNAGSGELVFANAKVEPKNSYTIYIADKTAPNVTFVGCDLIGTNRTGTIIYGYSSSNSTTKFTVKDCDAHGLSYIISIRQGGYKVHVENVTADHMAYVLRTLKCDSVYVKNLTATDVWVGIEVRNDGPSNTRTLTLENVNIQITPYNGEYFAPVNGTLSNPTYATFNIYATNCTFTKDDGTSFEKTEWFQGNNGYKVIRTNIASASLLLNDKVGIYFNLDNSAVLDGYYAVITNKTTGETWTVPATDWNGNKILVTLAAKQMADELTVVIKWGDREISNTITTSISTYYKNGVDKGIFSDKDKALLEAMLHYGAQAQKAFRHNTANLANAGIAAVQNVTVENKMEGERYYGASLNLDDHVIFNFKFFAGGVNADYAVVTFADGSTKRIEFRDANGEYLPEILERNSANVLLYVIKLDDIDLADVADDITCTIYWAHGEGDEDDEAIHTATDSVLSYCARAMEGLANMKETNEEKYNGQKFKEDFYQALANYVAAVKGYAEDYEV